MHPQDGSKYVHAEDGNTMVGKKPDKKPFGRDGPPKGYPKEPTTYADPENWRYPVHTPWHAKAARRYFDETANRTKYTQEEQAYIDQRIDQALEKFGKTGATVRRRGPPQNATSRRVEELSLDQLLRLFLGATRLHRAMEMDDSLVSISDSSPEHLAGKVKEYVVDIDLKNRKIMHDCQDWAKNIDSSNMCKHLGKFLLTIDRDRATNLLREILSNMKKWTFSAPETTK